MNVRGILGTAVLAMAMTVQASAFERSDLRETKLMAKELALSAERVHLTADKQATNMRSEQRMVKALDRFADSAAQFVQVVDGYFDDPTETKRTLALLNEDAAIVNRSIRRARPMAAVLKDWDTCARNLEKINAEFEGGAEAQTTVQTDVSPTGTRIETRTETTVETRYHTVDGVRYPRNGNLYFRDGKWIEIAATPAEPVTKKSVAKQVLRSILTDR
jgi:hypothetical protein